MSLLVGHTFHEPPGWPHDVLVGHTTSWLAKRRPQSKHVAWDYCDMQQLKNNVVAHSDIATPLFCGKQVAADYMAVVPVLNAAIVEACRKLE